MLRTYLAAKSAVRGKSIFSSPKANRSSLLRSDSAHRSSIEPLESRHLLSATVIQVNTFQDIVDPNDAFVSLREAVLMANASPEDNEIRLSAGTYTLTRQGSNEDAGLTGDLDIKANGSLAIVGAGRDDTTIDAAGLYNAGVGYGDRIFDLATESNLSLQRVTLTDGMLGAYPQSGGAMRLSQATASIMDTSFIRNIASTGGAISASRSSIVLSDSTFESNAGGSFGGAINSSQSQVEIYRSEFTMNSASIGGAIYSSGQLALHDTTISKNSGKAGGAVFIGGGSAHFIDSVMSQNAAESGGGALAINNGAIVTMQTVRVSENTAQTGAGISVNTGALTVLDSTIEYNTAERLGGGVYTGDLTSPNQIEIRDSAIRGNFAGEAGGGLYTHRGAKARMANTSLVGNSTDGYGGAIFNSNDSQLQLVAASVIGNAAIAGGAVFNASSAQLNVLDSTLANNQSLTDGGAIYNTASGRVHLVNSTISGNSARGFGGGVYSSQAASVTELFNSTIALNRADDRGIGLGFGGGVFAGAGATTVLQNSIMIGNRKGDPSLGSPDDIGLGTPDAIDASSRYNLVADPASAGGLVNGVNGNIVGDGLGGQLDANTVIDPTLQDSGGLTLTHALRHTGVAVNAGDPAFDPSSTVPALNFDQRGDGYPRVVSGRIDIGAFETKTDPLPVDGVITVTTFDDIVAIDGLWSLREAVLWANAHSEDNEIVLAAGTYTLTRQGAKEDAGLTGDLDITNNGSLKIVGAGRDNTTIDASGLLDAELGYGDRIFDVLAGADVDIEGVALTGGKTGPGLSYISANGGAIRIRSAALSLVDSTFTGNSSAADGGAIASEDSYVSVDSSLFSENTAGEGGAIYHEFEFFSDIPDVPNLVVLNSQLTANQAGGGGAIWNSGKMHVEQSILSGNEVAGFGGAVYSEGLATVIDSQITDNRAENAGGIFSQFERYLPDGYAFEIVQSNVSGNTATSDYWQAGGGGIVNIGRMLVQDSTINDNSTLTQGGGIQNHISLNNGLLHVVDSSFSGNTAGIGGAIHNFHAPAIIVDSTFTDNSATYGGALAREGSGGQLEVWASTFELITAIESGGAIHGALSVSTSYFIGNSAKNGGALAGQVGTILASTFVNNSATNDGGAIFAESPPLWIVNSTVSGNSAKRGGGIAVAPHGQLHLLNSTVVLNHAEGADSIGGGLAVLAQASAMLSNSIIAGNLAGVSGDQTPIDIALVGGSLDPASSYNLVGDPSSAGGLVNGVNGNIVGDGLGDVLDVGTVIDTSLADNGGPTPTHALLSGGAAVNAGDPAFDTNSTSPPTLFDQRGAGFARITGGRVDIGAFEFGSQYEPLVVGRHVFYNNSNYDFLFDRDAIDPTKQALLPDGSLADASNITSYSRGINGIIVDLAGSHPNITADDFIFRIGANNDPASWAAAPEPAAIQVYAGQGVGGADRVVITWPDGAIVNTYLQVIVAANEDSGLAKEDVFFFGNRVGDSFNTQPPAAFVTSAADELAARNATPKANLAVSNAFDFDKSRTISSADMLIARTNPGFLPRIQIAPAAEASPLAAAAMPTAFVPGVSDMPKAEAGANAVASARAHVAATPEVASTPNEPLPARSGSVVQQRLVDRAVSLLWDEPSDFLAGSTADDALGDRFALLDDFILELIQRN